MASCNGCVGQLARERAHLSNVGQAGPMNWWCTRDTNELCDFSWSSIVQESKCQVRWVEARFIALSFQLSLSGESSHADWEYFGKKGLQEDDSGWGLLYLSFAGKEAHLYLFYTGNSQNLPVDIPVRKRWHQQQRHYQQGQGITKEMWWGHQQTQNPDNPVLAFGYPFLEAFVKNLKEYPLLLGALA